MGTVVLPDLGGDVEGDDNTGARPAEVSRLLRELEAENEYVRRKVAAQAQEEVLCVTSLDCRLRYKSIPADELTAQEHAALARLDADGNGDQP